MPFNPQALKQAQTSGYDEPPPPADYEAVMYEATIFESKAGDAFLRINYRVVGGVQHDHEWSAVHSLEELNRDGDPNPALAVTARVLAELGVDVDSLDSMVSLRHELDRVEGGLYVVEVKRNGQYVNSTPTQRLDHKTPEQQSYGQQQPAPTPAPAPTPPASSPPPPPTATNGDVSNDASGFVSPPKRGDIDPETGDPIPF